MQVTMEEVAELRATMVKLGDEFLEVNEAYLNAVREYREARLALFAPRIEAALKAVVEEVADESSIS